MPPDLDIKELCDGAGVTPRTVHYYIQQGLLPSSGTTGSGARYSQEHLERLQLIRLLQNEHLPLAEINRRLSKLTGAEVRSLIDERRRVRETPQGSALDYVRKLLVAARTNVLWSKAKHSSRVAFDCSAASAVIVRASVVSRRTTSLKRMLRPPNMVKGVLEIARSSARRSATRSACRSNLGIQVWPVSSLVTGSRILESGGA